MIPPTALFKAFIDTIPTEDQLDNIYDSDFSQGSLSPTTSSFDPSLIALIPDEIFTFPTIPSNMLWHCPIEGGTCSYTINLCALSDTNLNGLVNTIVSKDEAINFLNRQWKSSDQELCTIFNQMVNAHWEDHLKELDIRYVHQGDDNVSDYFLDISSVCLC